MTWLSEFRGLDRRVWILSAARLIVTFGFSAVMPFLAIHLTRDRGVAAVVTGAIWTASGICSASVQWLAGELADRIGRRPVILGALAVRAANLAALGYAIQVRASIPAIALLCVMNAVLRAFIDPVAAAIVADLAPGERRVAAFSLQRIGVNIGWAAGPFAAAAALAADVSYAHLFYGSAPITLLAGVALARIPETRHTRAGAPRARLPRLADLTAIGRDRPFARFLWATFAFFLLQTQLYHTLSLYAAGHLGLTVAQVATLYFANGVLVVALQIPAAVYIRRIGTGRALVLGSILYAASYAACAAAVSQSTLLICVAAITVAEIIAAPAQQTRATTMAPEDRIGAYAGMFGLAQTIGQSLGPLVGTALLDLLPDRAVWLVLPIFGVLAALGYRRAQR